MSAPRITTFVNPRKKKEESTYRETNSIYLNPQDNGGEAVSIDIHVHDNGDSTNQWWFETEINTQCYGSHSTSVLISSGGLSPSNISEIGTFLIGLSHKYKVEKE